jgi:hypothetical protein
MIVNRQKGRECEKEDVNSYWTPLRKREGTGISKRKYCIVLGEVLVLEEAMDLSQDKTAE